MDASGTKLLANTVISLKLYSAIYFLLNSKVQLVPIRISELKNAECRRNRSGHCEKCGWTNIYKQRDQHHYWNRLECLNSSLPSSTSFPCVSCSSSEFWTTGIPGLAPTLSRLYDSSERRALNNAWFDILESLYGKGESSLFDDLRDDRMFSHPRIFPPLDT